MIILNLRSSQRHPASQPPPEKRSDIIKPLKVSLNELYSGTEKRLKVGRRLLDGTTEDKALEVQIHPGWKISLRDLEGVGVSDFSSRSPLVHVNPGWKSGTKIHFARAGNEQHGGEAQDVVVVVEEKSDEGKVVTTVELLDGRKMQVAAPLGVIKPGQEQTIYGEGIPIRKDGSVKKKGDMNGKWEVVFPDRWTLSFPS